MTRSSRKPGARAAAALCAAALVTAPAPAAANPLADYLTGWISLSSNLVGGRDAATGGGGVFTPPVKRVPDTSGGNIAGRLPEAGTVGQPLTVLGATGTVCRTFDAYGARFIVAGPDTSCGFASKVFATAMTGADPAKNIHFSSPRTMSVASPATGQKYNMICTEHDDTLFLCSDRDGGTAQVWAW